MREAIARVLDSRQYILGPEVAAFQNEFAAFCGAEHAVGVASGTDALEIALRAAGIGRGDRVVTVSHTAVATVSAILRAGAVPLFADIDPDTFTMDPASLERCLANSSGAPARAVIPVHLYGQMAPMEKIAALADHHDCIVIEDCAQCHGASRNGRPAGSFGAAAAWSFYPTKNLGAIGDAGMVTTGDEEFAARVKALREYGWASRRQVSDFAGVNSRLDEIQAAILRVKLPHLAEANRRRAEFAGRYAERLAASGAVTLPLRGEENTHVHHLYVVRLAERDRVLEELTAMGIPAAIHYPQPVHRQPLAREFAGANEAGPALPVTERVAGEILTLPLHPWLEPEHIDTVAAALAELVSRAS